MNNQFTLRVGYIGTGWTDRVQIPVFRLAGLTAQAICSGQVQNARRVAEKQQIPDVYDSWQELVQSNTVDLVSISAPPHTHAEMVIAALQAGKHVLCEKPTALNVGQAEAMLAAAQAAPAQLALIDHELRFDPARLHMRQLLRDGYVGSLLHLHFDRLGSERLNPNLPWSWWSDAEQGGGMLGAVGSHLLDEARWFGGRIEALTAQLQTAHYYRTNPATSSQQSVTADDHAQILLRFVSGAQGSVIASGTTPGGYGMNIRIVGTKGALWLDHQDQLWGMRGDKFPGNEWEPIPNQRDEAVIAELRKLNPAAPTVNPFAIGTYVNPFAIGTYYLGKALLDTLKTGNTTIADAASLYDGLVVQRALDGARLSYEKQNWVRL